MAALISAHGFITSPPARLAGPAMAAACGQQMFNNQKADNYGNIQGELQVANGQSDFNAAECDVWTCKAFKYEDNTDKVQTYSVGDTVPITFDIRAPHLGVANVSIVTSDGVTVSQPLISWDVFASNAIPLSEQTNETSFSITIPDVGDACSTPGACVIQHFWDARSIDQTYESCIDVVIGGSGSGSGSTPAPPTNSSSSSAVPSSSSSAPSTLSSSAASSPPTTLTSATVPLSTGVSAPISIPALPISANATSTKKPCSKKPTATGGASVGVPSGVAGSTGLPPSIPNTLSTVAVPSSPSVPSASAPTTEPSATGGAGAGAGAGAGNASSVEQIIEMIMELIQGLVGQKGQ
ncbi:MAG: hypothetical protein Q9160_004060 [Pyrenula sp. 1 TL-2023]